MLHLIHQTKKCNIIGDLGYRGWTLAKPLKHVYMNNRVVGVMKKHVSTCNSNPKETFQETCCLWWSSGTGHCLQVLLVGNKSNHIDNYEKISTLDLVNTSKGKSKMTTHRIKEFCLYNSDSRHHCKAFCVYAFGMR